MYEYGPECVSTRKEKINRLGSRTERRRSFTLRESKAARCVGGSPRGFFRRWESEEGARRT